MIFGIILKFGEKLLFLHDENINYTSMQELYQENVNRDVVILKSPEKSGLIPSQIIYVEGAYNETVNQIIKQNYENLTDKFLLSGFDFVYYPLVVDCFKYLPSSQLRSLVKYCYPYVSASYHPAVFEYDIRSIYPKIHQLFAALGYQEEVSPGFLRLSNDTATDDGFTFEYFKFDLSDPNDIQLQIDNYIKRFAQETAISSVYVTIENTPPKAHPIKVMFRPITNKIRSYLIKLFDKLFEEADQTSAELAKKLTHITGVEKLKDPNLLAYIAKNDMDSDVRMAAVKNLTDTDVLAYVAKNDRDRDVRMEAVERLTSQTLDQELYDNIAKKDKVYADIAKNGKDWIVRMIAVEKLTDRALLYYIANFDNNSVVRMAAVEKLADQDYVIKKHTDSYDIDRVFAAYLSDEDGQSFSVVRAKKNKKADQKTINMYEAKIKKFIYQTNELGIYSLFFSGSIKPDLYIENETKISRLEIDEKYNILLPDYENTQIDMATLPKALFILFINHPEGILLKEISDHETELKAIYLIISKRVNEKNKEESIDLLCSPFDNSINEKINRIEYAFTKKRIFFPRARHYIITDIEDEKKCIIIDRKKVTIPKKIMKVVKEILEDTVKNGKIIKTRLFAARNLVQFDYNLKEDLLTYLIHFCGNVLKNSESKEVRVLAAEILMAIYQKYGRKEIEEYNGVFIRTEQGVYSDYADDSGVHTDVASTNSRDIFFDAKGGFTSKICW